MGVDNEKNKYSAAWVAFWAVIIAALIGAITNLAVAGKVSLFNSDEKPLDEVSNENIFIQSFDNSEGSFDTSVWACPIGNCNAQNVFQQNGSLVFKFNNLETWGTYMNSKQTWRTENLISLEGRIQIQEKSIGGVFLGLNEGVGCSISYKSSNKTPIIHCDLNTEYTTIDIEVGFDTWYTIRIDYDSITKEQKFFYEDKLIGQYKQIDLPDSLSIAIGAWAGENQSVEAYIDNIIVRTKP